MELSALLDKTYRTGDGVFAVDRSQSIVYWNRGAQQLLGYTNEEAVGKQCFKIMQGMTEEGQVNCISGCPLLNGVSDDDLVTGQNILARSRDGSSCWLSITHVFLKTLNGNDEAVIHIFRDVTKEVEAKRLLEQIGEQISGHLPSASATSSQQNTQHNEEAGRSTEAELTEREKQVLGLLAQGKATNEISKILVISNTTTRNHIQNILAKLGVHNRLEAVSYALRHKVIEPGFLFDGDPLEQTS